MLPWDLNIRCINVCIAAGWRGSCTQLQHQHEELRMCSAWPNCLRSLLEWGFRRAHAVISLFCEWALTRALLQIMYVPRKGGVMGEISECSWQHRGKNRSCRGYLAKLKRIFFSDRLWNFNVSLPGRLLTVLFSTNFGIPVRQDPYFALSWSPHL